MKRIAGCLVLVSKDVPVEVSKVAAERHGIEDAPHILHLVQQSQTCMKGAASSVLAILCCIFTQEKNVRIAFASIAESVIKREPEDRSCCRVIEL